MAKRKRLTPARLTDDVIPDAALETKSVFPRYPNGVYQTPARPPIADVAHDAAASAALDEVTQTLAAARTEGRLIQQIALDQIDADYLVRDRMDADADEMATLTASLRARGQQTAIEVTQLENGRYGLISGWRRLNAMREICAETPELNTILAIIRTPEDSADAYLAMVEENEIRVGLSYYERARIVARAVDRGVYAKDRIALSALFHAASRPKRSKIGAFVRIVRALDADLRFPTSLTERTGLALAQALDADPAVLPRLAASLRPPAPTPEAELAAIMAALRPKDAATSSRASPDLLPNGLQLTSGHQGKLTIEGPLMRDAAFRAKLLTWLSEN